MDSEVKIRDSSKLQEMMECERRFFFRHVLGWEKDVDNRHLVFGSAMHKAIEILLLNGYSAEAVMMAYNDGFLPEYRKTFSEETDGDHAKSPSSALNMLMTYTTHPMTAHDFDKYEVQFTEVMGSFPLTEKATLHTRMDALLIEKDKNQIVVMEHKTGSRLTQSWQDQWLLSLQIGSYIHCANCVYGEDKVRGAIVNGMMFPSKTKVDITRVPVYKNHDQMEVWYTTAAYWCDKIDIELDIMREEVDSKPKVMTAFPMDTKACTDYFGCPYLDFCLSWPNPLLRADEPPLGFRERFWDPRDERPARKVIEIPREGAGNAS